MTTVAQFQSKALDDMEKQIATSERQIDMLKESAASARARAAADEETARGLRASADMMRRMIAVERARQIDQVSRVAI